MSEPLKVALEMAIRLIEKEKYRYRGYDESGHAIACDSDINVLRAHLHTLDQYEKVRELIEEYIGGHRPDDAVDPVIRRFLEESRRWLDLLRG